MSTKKLLFVFAVAACAACSGSDPSQDSADPADSTSEALERDANGACIKVGLTTHRVLDPLPDSYFHGYVRDRGTGRYGTSELKIEVKDYKVVTDKRGHTIDDEYHWFNGTVARAWGWDPCSRKWIVSAWATL